MTLGLVRTASIAIRIAVVAACAGCSSATTDPAFDDNGKEGRDTGQTESFVSTGSAGPFPDLTTSGLPSKANVLEALRRANDYWIAGHADPGDNRWARSVYFIGDLALYKVSKDRKYYDYVDGWARKNRWALSGGTQTEHADNHCAGQVYLELAALEPAPYKVAAIKESLNLAVERSSSDDWTWVDALFMAMPTFMKLGVQTGDARYFEKMYRLYRHTKSVEAAQGLYDQSGTHLWWRDGRFDLGPSGRTGEETYWARGNGWAFAALARVLDFLPERDPHRAEYVKNFQEMAAALAAVQRSDGFWNASLTKPQDFGGPETSGTAFFAYGMAWGLRRGLLDAPTYRPVLAAAWSALTLKALQSGGRLGFVQGVGDQPSSKQPVTVESTTDFGVGAFLLAGSQVYRLTNAD